MGGHVGIAGQAISTVLSTIGYVQASQPVNLLGGDKMATVTLRENSYGCFISGSNETTHIFEDVLKHTALKPARTVKIKKFGTEWSEKIYHVLEVETGIVLVEERCWGFDGDDRQTKAWNRHSKVEILFLPDKYEGYQRFVEYWRYDAEGFRFL